MCKVHSARFVRLRTAQTPKNMKSLRSWEINEKRGEKRAVSSSPQKLGICATQRLSCLRTRQNCLLMLLHRIRSTSPTSNFIKFSLRFLVVFFSSAGVWRGAPKRPRLLGRKGNNEKGKSTGEGKRRHQKKRSPLPPRHETCTRSPRTCTQIGGKIKTRNSKDFAEGFFHIF